MRRSKAEVERYISSMEGLSPGQKEKPIKGFLFAKMYYDAKEYELAKRHVSDYLKVQVRDPKAHRFLGQLYEQEGEVEKAIGCYKRSMDLNPAQRDLVLKVAELLCSGSEPDSRAEFWVEKAAKCFPGHPTIFDLKNKLLTAQGHSDQNQFMDLLQSELQLRPANVQVNQKLVQLYLSKDRLGEALKHCLAVESQGVLRHSLDWYSTFIDVLKKGVAQRSGADQEKMRRTLQKELLLAHCNLLRLSLGEKDCRGSVEALQMFDQTMQSLVSTASKSADALAEMFSEMRGHLYLYAGTLLLKMAKEKQQQWRAVADLAGLCYLIAYQVPKPKSAPEKSDPAAPPLINMLACYRQSQSGHMLLNLNQEPKRFIEEVVEVHGGRSGQEALCELLYGSATPADRWYIGNDDLSGVKAEIPSIQDLTEADSGCVLYSGDLQQLVWLGLQWTLRGQTPSLRVWLRQLFPRLTLETFKLDTNSPESLCLLDLEVFVCGVVYVSHTQLQLCSNRSPSAVSLCEPRCLPLQLSKLLSSHRQREWWSAVHNLIHTKTIPNMSGTLRMIIQRGLSTLRVREKHGLQPALLIHWAQHLSSVGDGMNSYYDQKEYIGRSVHYWTCVLPLLEKIRRKCSIPEPLDPMFLHFSCKNIQVSEIKALEQEAMVAFATNLDVEGRTEEAICSLNKINSITAHWQLARIYKRLSEEAENGAEENQDICFNRRLQFKNYLLRVINAGADDPEKLPVSLEELMDLLTELEHQLGENGQDVNGLYQGFPITSSPRTQAEPFQTHSTTSPGRSGQSPRRRPFSPKTPPAWVEDQKSVLQMLCEQVQALKNEVHDLRLNSSGATETPYSGVHRGNYTADGFQEPYSAAQNFHGVPLTVATTGPSAYYSQSPASQYLLRPAANLTPSKGPVYNMNRLPQPHMYSYQQPTHTPPLQTPSMYNQDQVFSTPLRYESPASNLVSPFNEDYSAHNVPQPSANPPLPEPGYFTKPPVIPAPSSKVVDLKISSGQQVPSESVKVPGMGGGVGQPAFKFNSNFKSNDGDFTFSASDSKAKNESLLGLLISDFPSNSALKFPTMSSTPGGVITEGKPSCRFAFTDFAQGKSSFANVSYGLGRESEERCESDEGTQLEEDEDGPHFEPIVPLPDKVDVKTGEEEEEEMFCNRAKLFRFEAETTEWKERGIGCIKILKHRTSGKYRLLMRREQVLKICANHYITSDMVLKPNAGSDKSWVWHAIDYADESPKNEQLAIRFKTVDEAALFKRKFEEAQRSLSDSVQHQHVVDGPPAIQVVSLRKTDLMAKFGKKEGEWDCDVCCVRNASSARACVSCNSPNPNAPAPSQPKPEKSSSIVVTPVPSAQTFTFGLNEGSKAAGGFKGFGAQIPFSFKFGTDAPSTQSSQAAPTAVPSAMPPPKNQSPSIQVVSSVPQDLSFGSKFAKKPGQWDCPTCAIRNEASVASCPACDTSNPSAPTPAAPEPAKQPVTTGFSFGSFSGFGKPTSKEGLWDCESCLVRNEPSVNTCVSCGTPCLERINATWDCDCLVRNEGMANSCKSCKKPKPNHAPTPSAQPVLGGKSTMNGGSGLQFGKPTKNGQVVAGQLGSGGGGSVADSSGGSSKFLFSKNSFSSGFKFGLKEPETKATDATDDCPLMTGKSAGFSFADLAKTSQGAFQFGKKDPSFKGFAGAGEQLFTSSPQTPKVADSSFGQEGDEMYRTEEHDDIQFEPVVAMPDKVDVITGEEDEKCLYMNRVKLFRFDPDIQQWKERGVGNLKLLRNNTNGRLRVLMRREQVLKVCANHWITTTMNLKPLAGSDRAWMWMASDFSEGDARLEQLAAKFKTPELAEEFRQKFVECQQLLLDIPLQTPHKLSSSDRTANLIQKAEEMKSGLMDLKSFLSHGRLDEEDRAAAVESSDIVIPSHAESMGPTLEWDNYDLHEDSADTSVYASPLASSPAQKTLFRFGESTAGFSFSFQPSISPSKSQAAANQSRTSVGTDDELESTHEEERDGQYFEPVVPMPDLVEISTGEENEQLVFSHRAKLYRYDKDLNQWKERGIGELKILQNFDTKRTRLIMRRDQVLKLCANHWITTDMKLEPMKGSEKAWIWSAYDFAEGAAKVEQLAVRFKLPETANSFKDFFDRARDAQETKTLILSTPSKDTSSSRETICGQAAIAVLEETTSEQTSLFSAEETTPTYSPQGTPKSVVSPPKFVFGTGAMEKFFGSPVLAQQVVASPTADGGRIKGPKSTQARGPDLPKPRFLVPEQVPVRRDQDDDSAVEIVFERVPSAEQAELARQLLLPKTFFLYKSEPGYVSDDGTDDEDYETAVRNLNGRLYPDLPTPQIVPHRGGAAEDPDCVIVWEKQPTQEEELRARTLQLPRTFFCGAGSDTDSEPSSPEDFNSEVQKVGQSEGISQEHPPSDDAAAPADTSRTPDPARPSTAHQGRPVDLSTNDPPSQSSTDTSTKDVPSFTFCSLGAFSFADLAKNSEEFAFGKQDSNFSWANAGAVVFGSGASTSQHDDDDDEDGGDDEANNAEIHFEPIVSLPEIVVKSGEEDEEILFKERTKLYRWDRDLNQWKERGVGDLKILFHPEKKFYRLLMRREQVLKVCANHTITRDMELKPMNTSTNALVWTANDCTEGEPKVEQLAARFKTAELAEAFRKTFTHCQNCMSQVDSSPSSKMAELTRPSNPQVFFSIAFDGEVIGQITMELFKHIVPKTAENFRALCTGEKGFGYRNSIIHRIVPDFVCQGGDITKQDGTGGQSIYGGKFEDENFEVRHTGPGLLSMANSGRDTNGSQFFITLKKAEHLDFKHVAFGFIRDGMDVVRRMGELGSKTGKPSRTVTVVDCGQL